jgi:NADH-quinone oxidoreductase subunit E
MSTKCNCSKSQEMRKFDRVCEILDRHDRNPTKLIPILQEIQKEYRYLPKRVLSFVAISLDMPPARVYGVATFYSHFSLEPKGKYQIRLCDGTACHVRGSMRIYDALVKRLGLEPDQKTTKDMLFTVELVSCPGACGLAPVMTINDDVHGQVTPKSATALLEQIMEKEQNA